MPHAIRHGAPRWPPDAFAVTASILRQAAAYSSVIETWPPRGRRNWAEFISDIGRKWRAAAVEEDSLPTDVSNWWRAITDAGGHPIEAVCRNTGLCEALVELGAAADEASKGIGITGGPAPADAFEMRAIDILVRNGFRSLCDRITPDRAIVLPKLHTPRSGLTLRSLSHHLALCSPTEVDARWHWMPYPTHEWSLNLLLLPWPERVLPAHFWQSKGALRNMPENFGFFTCDVRQGQRLAMDRVRRAVERAQEVVGRVEAIIFPELALRGREHVTICRRTGVLVIGGLGEPAVRGRSGRNAVTVAVPTGRDVVSWVQEKHHRWRLDAGQIEQYGLGGQLDPTREWWEHIRSGPRELRFLHFNGWLTACVLICEDLARQDPVADVVRAVGPNLVICLLMDGPQLNFRWAARYATVLADDPGSSVLTLTSLGMAKLCRPRGELESREVALWKDALSGAAVEIRLSPQAAGVVLSLTRTFRKEWTVDGRDDAGTTGYLCLNGVHEIEV